MDDLIDPLHAEHESAGAEFQSYGNAEVVASYGATPLEYSALHRGVGVIDLPQRAILEVKGKDRLDFLNRLLTNQVCDKSAKMAMAAGQAVYSFLLNIKGRIIADLNVIEIGELIWLEVDGRAAGNVLAELNRYIIVDDVQVRHASELREIGLYGPSAAGVAANLGAEMLVRFWRDNPTGTEGANLVVSRNDTIDCWRRLVQLGARPTGWGAFNAARIEAGRPIFGIDFDETMLPAETGQLARGVSLTKGCYVGQEVVARMNARNVVAKRIVGIRMEDEALPLAGAQIFDEHSNAVGGITSSTVSPILSNAAIALGIVKHAFATAGTLLTIPAEGKLRQGRIVELPFVKHG